MCSRLVSQFWVQGVAYAASSCSYEAGLSLEIAGACWEHNDGVLQRFEALIRSDREIVRLIGPATQVSVDNIEPYLRAVQEGLDKL